MEQALILHKLAEILMKTEQYILRNADRMLPQQRSRMVDMGAIFLQDYQDDFFTHYQIKCLVSNMVDQHLGKQPMWLIDISSSTSDDVVLMNSSNAKKITLPANAYLNMHLTNYTH